MRISATLDRNLVSAKFLLDGLTPLSVVLKHQYTESGITRWINLKTLSITPKNADLKLNILNPYYYSDLYLEVNGVDYRVMNADEESEVITENPINNRVYTMDLIVEPEKHEIIISEPEMDPIPHTFEALSHKGAINLLDMADISVDKYFTFNNGGISFDVTDSIVTVSTDVIEWNHYSEITTAFTGDAPDSVKLILINIRGEERVVDIRNPYNLFGRTCFSDLITSSTKYIRMEFKYNPNFEQYKTVRIKDIFIGKVSQYYEAPQNARYVYTDTLEAHTTMTLSFEFDRLTPFGLRTLFSSVDNSGNGIKVFYSNSKVLVRKIQSGSIISNVFSPIVPNDKPIGVYLSDLELKIFSDSNQVKAVIGDYSIGAGSKSFELGACQLDPDYDSNARIKLHVYSGNKFA